MNGGGLSRVIRLDRVPAEPVVVEASETERAALARRFGLSAVVSLRAELTLVREGDSIVARGRLAARFAQLCAVSQEPFANSTDEPLAIRFVRALAAHDEEEEIEFSSEDADEVEYEGAAFDLGEAVAQSFGLALDPYACGPDAEEARREAGILDEDTPSGPFAALAALRPKT